MRKVFLALVRLLKKLPKRPSNRGFRHARPLTTVEERYYRHQQ